MQRLTSPCVLWLSIPAGGGGGRRRGRSQTGGLGQQQFQRPQRPKGKLARSNRGLGAGRGGAAERVWGAARWVHQHHIAALRISCEAKELRSPAPDHVRETRAPNSPEAVGSKCRMIPMRVADVTGQYGTTAAARAMQAAATGIATAPGGLLESDPHGTNSSATATLVPANMNRDASRRDRVTCSLQSGARSSSYSMAPAGCGGGAGRGRLTPCCARSQTQRRRAQHDAQVQRTRVPSSDQEAAGLVLRPGWRGALARS